MLLGHTLSQRALSCEVACRPGKREQYCALDWPRVPLRVRRFAHDTAQPQEVALLLRAGVVGTPTTRVAMALLRRGLIWDIEIRCVGH